MTRQAEVVKYRFFWRHVTRLFGNGLLTSAGGSVASAHALMAPAFRQEQLALSVDKVRSAAQNGFLTIGKMVKSVTSAQTLTIEIASKVLFDVELDRAVAGISRAVDRGIEEISRRFKQGIFIPDWIPTPGNRRYLATVRDLDAAVANILAERRARDRTDLLSTLLQSRDAEGRPMDARLLRDELVTLLLAGHETTALALTWTLSFLARHPEIAARMEEEIDAALEPGACRAPPILGRLRYLRLGNHRGHAPLSTRVHSGAGAVRKWRSVGAHLPPHHLSDEPVGCAPRSAVSPGARNLQAERWGNRQCPRFAYFPFGGGPRICIGRPLAMMEAKLVLAMVCQRFRLAASVGAPVRPYPSVTLHPDGPVRLVVTRRVPE